MDAGDDDLHIRIQAAGDGRLPSRTGLQLLQTTLPLTSDAIYATRAQTVRIRGEAHLSAALALGAALPETKIGKRPPAQRPQPVRPQPTYALGSASSSAKARSMPRFGAAW